MALTQVKTTGLADDAVTSAKIADDAVVTAAIADDAVTSAHMADDAIAAAGIADNAVVTAGINADAVTGAKIADDAIDSEHYTDGSIDTAHIADDQVTLAKMAGLARGKLIYGDSSGNPAALTVGSANQVLTADGTDVAWAAAAAGGKILQVKHSFESAHRSTSSNTFVDIGFPEFTITPTVATSKMLVFYRGTNANGGGSRGGIITIYRKVGSGGTYADMRTDGNNGGLTSIQSVSVNDIIGWTIMVEDDHNTTDTIYYKLYLRSNNSDSSTQIGRAAGGSDGSTSLTVWEFEP